MSCVLQNLHGANTQGSLGELEAYASPWVQFGVT